MNRGKNLFFLRGEVELEKDESPLFGHGSGSHNLKLKRKTGISQTQTFLWVIVGGKIVFQKHYKKHYKSKVSIIAQGVNAGKVKNTHGLLVYVLWVQWLKSLRLQTRDRAITWVDGRVSDNISNNLLNLWSQACSFHIKGAASFHRLG